MSDKDKTTGAPRSLDGLVSLPLGLAESLRDHCEDLRALRDWWEDEPRRTYQEDYRQMTKDLDQIIKIIEQANDIVSLGDSEGV